MAWLNCRCLLRPDPNGAKHSHISYNRIHQRETLCKNVPSWCFHVWLWALTGCCHQWESVDQFVWTIQRLFSPLSWQQSSFSLCYCPFSCQAHGVFFRMRLFFHMACWIIHLLCLNSTWHKRLFFSGSFIWRFTSLDANNMTSSTKRSEFISWWRSGPGLYVWIQHHFMSHHLLQRIIKLYGLMF